MQNLEIIQTKDVDAIFKKYPNHVKTQLSELRQLVLNTAEEIGLDQLEETLKWGEPSYLSKHGSTLRMDWKPKKPNQYALYFKCTSKLISTIKTLYGDLFRYENNRAIIFYPDDILPTSELKTCIKLALKYHKLKNLPNLGEQLTIEINN